MEHGDDHEISQTKLINLIKSIKDVGTLKYIYEFIILRFHLKEE